MANKWTLEQDEAINTEGSNIIVSAGAGSGKTAVLTERVLRKVKSGIHINNLLILTFTNAAAKEMKDRIRKKLIKEKLYDEANLIDNSYITTFDSYSLSIVKKYHTYLNINKDIKITEQSILNIKARELLDDIFNEYYMGNNKLFSNLINDFCFKDDKELKKLILKLNDKLDMRIDKEVYLKNYLKTYFDSLKIDNDINIYFLEIKKLIDKIKDIINELSLHLDSDYINELNNSLSKLFSSTNYDDVVKSLDIKLPRIPKNASMDAKNIKSKIPIILKKINELVIYENIDEIKDIINSTYDNISIIIDILYEFDKRFNEYKINYNMFSFKDISRMAIKIVEDNLDVRDELRNSYQEIMVDEYQDTDDIEEYFISLISNNNVYMVGDIKQSIYRFRNANPYIFKNKYDLYSNNSNGIKIDLLKNFRSRSEVLNNINLVFDTLMDDVYGGADYKKSHRMIFGNDTYNNEGRTNQSYDFSILTYNSDNKFTNAEKEMFIIGNDILDKINNNYKVFDKDSKILRNITYSDFVILIDRATEFDNYKKVFEYLHIPLTLYKDEELNSDKDILVIKNLLKLILCIDREDYGREFKYLFMSIGRSFLFRKSDQELFDIFVDNKFMESDIYKKLIDAYNYFYELSPKMFLLKLLDIFNYEEMLLTTYNIEIGRVRIEYFYNLLSDIEKTGMTINDFICYLDNIFDIDEKVKFSLNTSDSNSVKIMTIHKSKGLEFPICYFSGFSKEFSYKDLNDSILYSNKYGIVIPYFNSYTKPTIYKQLLKIDTRREEISEKIRLLYVALTRAKEKMIIVIPKIENSDIEKDKIKSFLDMIKIVYSNLDSYISCVDPICSRDYLINKKYNDYNKLVENKEINIYEVNYSEEVENEERFSKQTNKLITKEEQEKMDFGTKIHEILEMIDFKNPNYSVLDNFSKNKVKSFINSSLIQSNLDSKFYKEYEFTYLEDNNLMHGIIDLMIENDNEIIIIDYKLKNTIDDLYNKQLLGYKKVIENRTNKKVSTYLYSIIDESFMEVNLVTSKNLMD